MRSYKMSLFWLNWVMENCDSGPEWNFGSDATERINKLLKESTVTLLQVKQMLGKKGTK